MAKKLSGTTLEKLNGLKVCSQATSWCGDRSLQDYWDSCTDPSWVAALALKVADTDEEKKAVLSAVNDLLKADATIKQSAPLLAALSAASAFWKDPSVTTRAALKKATAGVAAVACASSVAEGEPTSNKMLFLAATLVEHFVKVVLLLSNGNDSTAEVGIRMVIDSLVTLIVLRTACSEADAQESLMSIRQVLAKTREAL